MTLLVNGKSVKVELVGFVSTWLPGEDPGPGGMQDNVYRSTDGQEFVEVYITCSWRRYDRKRDGLIWTEEEWSYAEQKAKRDGKPYTPPFFNKVDGAPDRYTLPVD